MFRTALCRWPLAAALLAASSACSPPPTQPPAALPVWEETFDGTEIDPGAWTYDLGTGCDRGICGWGNQELQSYTQRPDNARIENGRLVIEARREAHDGQPFTSARLKTESRMHFRYGTLKARIRLPEAGDGLWPAFWMLGAVGQWPGRGEIDIMEAGSAGAIADGVANRRIGAAVHWDRDGTKDDRDGEHTHAADLHRDFHVYRLDWDPSSIRMSIDDRQFFEFDISDPDRDSVHEFHRPHFVLLNLAVAGTYTGIGSPDAVTAPLPGRMEVDYVRLYQDHPDSLLLTGADAAAQADTTD